MSGKDVFVSIITVHEPRSCPHTAYSLTHNPVLRTDYRPDPQNAKSSYSAIALAAGAWKPYQVFAIGGIARILCMMYSPTFASMFDAPFAEYIGQANAVALSMVPGALVLLKLGDVIQKNKWHETNVGLLVLTVSCIITMLFFRAL
jgi:hypothetical protein